MATLRLQQLASRHVGPVDLVIAEGECVCLHGASGSGKSLLLRAIADLDEHTGEVFLDQVACNSLQADTWRSRVMLIGAESHWWAPSVGEHFPDSFDYAQLSQLGLPIDALSWEVSRCSTGERQRLALLRALARHPAALLLDEPTGNLDETSTAQVETLLADYRNTHAAPVLWVSHDPGQGARVAQRRFLLMDGLLREET